MARPPFSAAKPVRPPGRGSGARRARRLSLPARLAVGGLLLSLAGCLTPGIGVPFPSTVLVPHPRQVPPDLTEKKLQEMYTTSPNRDPDGRGVLAVVWQQSQMTLVVPQLARKRELMNEVALARTPDEQRAVLEAVTREHTENLVFDGMLIGDFAFGTDPDWYLPDGMYLLDDRGRRFRPVSAHAVKPISASHLAVLAARRGVESGAGRRNARFLRLVFPGAALRPDTRALTLYLAALRRRISFTWVFDPSYSPPGPAFRPEAGSGLNRMFRTPQG